MSQSNSAYRPQNPKATARSRHAQHTSQTKGAGSQPTEPACRTRAVGRGVERREWRELAYNSRTCAFFDPCKWSECFPDGAPDEDAISTVVRSCREPTTFHRPRNGDEPTCDHNGVSEPDRNDPAQISRVVVESVTDLQVGQQVIWEDRERPLTVIKATTEPDGTVDLRGPAGGEYVIEGRPEHRQPYYVLGDGYRSEIARVRPEDGAGAV